MINSKETVLEPMDVESINNFYPINDKVSGLKACINLNKSRMAIKISFEEACGIGYDGFGNHSHFYDHY